MSGKLLMLAKLSLKSFIYDVAETFSFPDQTMAEIYKKYMIENIMINHILTLTALPYNLHLFQTLTVICLKTSLEIFF